MSRCQNETLIKTCEECVALQDPYCAWSLRKGQCLSGVIEKHIHEKEQSNNEESEVMFVQDIQNGSPSLCPIRKEIDLNKTKLIENNGKYSFL